MSGHLAVVPVKGLVDSKRRLSNYLSTETRRTLVKALLEDVLRTLHQAGTYSKVIVISPDENVGEEAQTHRSSFVKQNTLGLNAAVEQATRIALKERAWSITSVLADIPLAEPEDFVELSALGGDEPKVVIVPSLNGGTNVMTIAPPNAIDPAYGRWSYARHLRLAQKKQLKTYSMSNPRISFDVDTIQDLAKLRRLDAGKRTSSGRVVSEVARLSNLARTSRERRSLLNFG